MKISINVFALSPCVPGVPLSPSCPAIAFDNDSSDILRQFAAQDGGSRWRDGVAKDMQKFASLALDKISDKLSI